MDKLQYFTIENVINYSFSQIKKIGIANFVANKIENSLSVH
jgi:hypothetical protein